MLHGLKQSALFAGPENINGNMEIKYMVIFNETDEYGDSLIVSQYPNSDSYFITWFDGELIEFSSEQAIKLADAIYAREAERFKESM